MIKRIDFRNKIYLLFIGSFFLFGTLSFVNISLNLSKLDTSLTKEKIKDSFNRLEYALAEQIKKAQDGLRAISENKNNIYILNLINGYQELEAYNKEIFDAQKIKLLTLNADTLSSGFLDGVLFYDTKKRLSAILFKKEGKLYGYYNSYSGGSEQLIQGMNPLGKRGDDERELAKKIIETVDLKNGDFESFFTECGEHFSYISSYKVYKNYTQEGQIGYIVGIKLFGGEFAREMEKATKLTFWITGDKIHLNDVRYEGMKEVQEIATPLNTSPRFKESAEGAIWSSQYIQGKKGNINFSFYSQGRYYEEYLNNSIINIAALFLIVSVSVVLLMVYLIKKSVTNPVDKLLQNVKNLENENYAEIEHIDSGDEIGTLSDKFYTMSLAIKERNEELKRVNKNLELRIAQEIEKHREKDRILLEKSKIDSMAELLVNVSHHWRQPLNAIGLAIQNIQEAYEYGELDKEFLDGMVDKGLKELLFLSSTIDVFTDVFAKNEKKESFEVKSALEELFNLFGNQLSMLSIDFSIEDGDGCVLFSQKRILQQVVSNMVMNAIDSIKKRLEVHEIEKGRILTRIECLENGARISIRDNGTGVRDDIKDRIFEPYFTEKFKSKGTGLGLYLTKILVENNLSGNIGFRNLNEGCEFFIEITNLNQ